MHEGVHEEEDITLLHHAFFAHANVVHHGGQLQAWSNCPLPAYRGWHRAQGDLYGGSHQPPRQTKTDGLIVTLTNGSA
ncbi:hypothetical protein TNCV_4361751 [Trichonephila clavipes]|nr:hypothetical protein TNCV_4361751 [Trichonephila clavipes]